MRKLLIGALGSLALSFGAPAFAAFTLNFEGVCDFGEVQGFYNGGTDSCGNSGVNYGVAFGAGSLGLIDADSGGGGNFANEPTPNTILFWLNSGSAILNYAAGFDTGFSFFYTSSTAAKVSVWDGLNATGNLLGEIDLAANFTGDNCTGDPSGTFCNWDIGFLGFAGTAMSIDFGGTANQTGYDNVTFGSIDPRPVPEPATLALLGVALAGLGFSARRRAR